MNKNSFIKLTSILKFDLKRMFCQLSTYIFLLIAFISPILILVMTTLMDGQVTVNPETNVETVIEGFDNVWQIISSISGESNMMSMTSMCNLDLMYFLIIVFVCLFIGDDFRSGYVKIMFTYRVSKKEYVTSKITTSIIFGCSAVLLFFIGSMLGGAISGLSFENDACTLYNIIMCMLSKFCLVAMFASFAAIMSYISKTKTWLSMILSLSLSMIFYMMISLLAPLNATIINLVLCFIISNIVAITVSIIGNIILKKTNLI